MVVSYIVLVLGKDIPPLLTSFNLNILSNSFNIVIHDMSHKEFE